jgi:carbamate kinase
MVAGLEKNSLIVVALGGNAFMRKGESFDAQWRNVRIAAETIASLVEQGYRVVVTHGNGPQVGIILEWVQRAGKESSRGITLDVADAMTQGWLGYMLQQAIGNALEERGLERRVVAVVSQSLVSKDDPAWREPTKPIGPFYSKEEAEKLAIEYGWVFKPDPRGGYRRVVPSPKPLSIVEARTVRMLVDNGYVVIAVGGGGIPVVRSNHWIQGVEAVVDKDYASAVLAREIDADVLAILTDVEGAYVDYGRPSQKLIKCMTPHKARELLEKGEFPKGSMGPKVEAGAMFVEHNKNGFSLIAMLERAREALEGLTGTRIMSDCEGQDILFF